jgi:hypothetical protein
MNNIDISIWGIRDGFQQGGFFHSHNLPAVKEIQQDRFRSVKNAIGREGFFMTHRKGGKFIVTYCDTSIKEYNPTSKRGAYVCFSLIIDEMLAFSNSPRLVLKELAAFYVSRVGDTNSNNFDAEDIQAYTRKIQTEQKRTSGSVLSGSHYLYYTSQEKIDEVMTGKLAFVNLSELVLIPNNEIDPKSNSFLDLDFYDDSFGEKPRYFNLKSAQELYENDENQKRKKEEEERIKKEKERIRLEEEAKQGRTLENQIAILLNQNRLDEAYKLFKESSAAVQAKIAQPVLNDLKLRLQKRDLDDVENRKKQEDSERITEIDKFLQQGDLDNACLIYGKLHDKFSKDLPDEKRKQIQAHNTQKLEEEARIQKEEAEKKQKEATRKKRNKIILLSSVGGILILFIVSFFTAVPASIWDADNDGYHIYMDDNCPDEKGTINGCPDQDKDGVPNNLDKCPNEKGSVDGCPDSDGDGVLDKDDDCDTLKGLKENNGCPKTPKADSTQRQTPVESGNDIALQSDADKLMKGEAVNTTGIEFFRKNPIFGKWVKFYKKNYSYSTDKQKGYVDVNSQTTVDLLNKYYGLKGELKKGAKTTAPITQTPTTGQTTKPQNQTTPKPPTSKLTPDEEKKLNDLLVKSVTTPLSSDELKIKNALIKKRDGKL